MKLIEETYDGELNFEILSQNVGDDEIELELSAEYNGETVGMKVFVPVMKRRALFKAVTVLRTSGSVRFESSGEASDRLVRTLNELWDPEFEVSDGFTDGAAELEFSVLNRELYDPMTDKNYLRLYTNISMETGDSFDDINVEIGFNFNLSRDRASLVEQKRELRDDFLALIMA